MFSRRIRHCVLCIDDVMCSPAGAPGRPTGRRGGVAGGQNAGVSGRLPGEVQTVYRLSRDE